MPLRAIYVACSGAFGSMMVFAAPPLLGQPSQPSRCATLASHVAAEVLHGPVRLHEYTNRCDWELVSDPMAFIQFSVTQSGALGVNTKVPHQILKDVGDSAAWYPVPGSYYLSVYAKHNQIDVWIYTQQDGVATPTNDLAGCETVAREIVKNLDAGR